MANTKKNQPKPKQRLEELIRLLSDGKIHIRKDLAAQLQISINSLSTDLNKLRGSGFKIESPNRSGYVQLIISPENTDFYKKYDALTSDLLLEYLILFQLQNASQGKTFAQLYQGCLSDINPDYIPSEIPSSFFNPYTSVDPKKYSGEKLEQRRKIREQEKSLKQQYSQELLENYANSNNQLALSFKKLRQVIHSLMEKNYIERSNVYKLTNAAPFVLVKSAVELGDFLSDFSIDGPSAQWKNSLDTFYQKAALFTITDEDRPASDHHYIIAGKSNLISESTRYKLRKLLSYPYKKRVLSIPYTTNHGQKINYPFSTALLIYSQEKTQYYLLGNVNGQKTCLRLENIDVNHIRALNEKNTIYESPEYIRIFDEMFSISLDDPIQVKVRFQNFGSKPGKISNMERRLRLLVEQRSNSGANVEITDDKKELIYTDTLRGLEDFARYLRRYGRAALVVEPPELKARMMTTADRVIAAYKERGLIDESDESI